MPREVIEKTATLLSNLMQHSAHLPKFLTCPPRTAGPLAPRIPVFKVMLSNQYVNKNKLFTLLE